MAADSSSVIAALSNSSSHRGLYRQISSFLLPFADLVPLDAHDPATTTKKKKKTTTRKKKKNDEEADNGAAHLRSLAKQFFPFLSQILKLLPSIIRNPSKGSEDGGGGGEGVEGVDELFCVYKLALDCLECIMPCLAGKSYSVHLQRSRLVCCLEVCGRYAEAEEMAFSLLKSLASVVNSTGLVVKRGVRGVRGKVGKGSGRFLPALSGGSVDSDDSELAVLVVEVAVRVVGCNFKSNTKDGASYGRVIAIVEELQPWLRVLDTDVYGKYQSALVNALYKCSLFLSREAMCFDVNLVLQFCMMTLQECLKSSLRDQLPKMSRRICSSFDLKWEDRSLIILDMLKFSLGSILCKCKVDVVYNVNEIFEFICYCAESCSGARMDISKDAFKILSSGGHDHVEGLPTVTSICKLYAVGLYFSASSNLAKHSGHSDDGSAFTHLLNSRDCDPILSSSLEILACKFQNSEHHNIVFSNTSFKDAKYIVSTDQVSAIVSACQQGHGKLSLFSCFNALEFTCKLLGNCVSIAWKDMVSRGKAVQFSPNIVYIHDMFLQFHDLYFEMDRSIEATEKQKERLNESRGSLLVATAAALRISLGTNRKRKNIETLINNLISSEWVKPQELKFLISSFYNIGASLYNIKQVEQASVALHLSCTAVWAHVKLLCQMYLVEIKGSHNITSSEDAIKDVIAVACEKSAAIFGVLCRCDDANVCDFMVNSLLSWAAARNILGSLISPIKLVNQWVKIMWKDIKESSTVDDVPFLYSFLSSHVSAMSKKTIGMILEQELFAYEEVAALNPNLCQAMQRKIADILLHDIYATKEFFLQKAKILVIKGKSLRASGVDGLQSCIQCLSEAIFLLNDISGDYVGKYLLHHQLAVTYCLHAQCVHEANQDLEVMFHDVRSALNLWSKVNFQGPCCVDDHVDLVTGNTILLLYNIAELMSLKGCLELQTEILKLIVRYWKLNSVPLERCIAMLWRDRRLNHALCPLPLDADFIKSASQHFGFDANSFDVWLHSLKDMPSAAIGLLQKLLLSDFIMPQVGIYNTERSLGFKVTIEEVEATASSLVSSVPVANHSAFSAAYLYYDLSERLSLDGRFYEALNYAREALRLRRKILQKKFIYSSKQQSTEFKRTGQSTGEGCDRIHLEAIGSVITEAWPHFHASRDLEHSFISPWSILRCYLESTLQVGLIHETIGDGVEAEIYLEMGKNICVSQNLQFCQATFSSHLGQVYRRKQWYDLAKNEFHAARNVLHENDMLVSCKCCKLVLDVNIDMQIGDLSINLSENASQTPSAESLSCVLDLYKSALERLNKTNVGVSVNNETSKAVIRNRKVLSSKTELRSFFCFDCIRYNDSLAYSDNEPKQSTSVVQCNTESQGQNIIKGVQKKRNPLLRSKQILSSDVNLSSSNSHDHSSCIEAPDVSHEGDHNYHGTNCWTCFLIKIAETGSMQDIIYQKWECHRRRLLLKLLSRIGRCTNIHNGIHNVHKWFLQSMSMLCMKDPCHQTHSTMLYPSFLKFIEEERPGDTFSMERAVILCDMSFFFVKNCLSEIPRTKCCCLSNIQLPTIISWLLRAFMLTHELPLLFQKIAQLLATLFLLSTLGGNYSLPCSFTKSLSISHWAAYFHQASLGTFLHHQQLSAVKEKKCNSMDESFLCAGTAERPTNTSNLFRIVPEKLAQFDRFVKDFFLSLPNLTVICISFLDDNYINLLGEALLLSSFVPAWLLLSRLNADGQPIAVLLPVDIVNEESLEDGPASCSSLFSEGTEPLKAWQCPWSDTVVDYVAPHFKSMLEENYLSLSNIMPDSCDTHQSRFKWWSQRTRLNNRLSKFLRSMEDSWLGPWRCLFQGERSHHECLDKVLTKLVHDLKSKCNIEINQMLLKAIIGGAGSLAEAIACFQQLLLYGGCFGRGECCGEGRFRAFSTATDVESENITHLSCQLMLEAATELLKESVGREPIILVLDTDVQMLPWENIPVLRKQEVYRMPSVGSISVTLKERSCHSEGTNLPGFNYPLVDPWNTYYLLNPSGDLYDTQVEFDKWFRNLKWKGKTGNAPSTEELAAALQSHDLFIYFGHGNGTQYIPGHEIRKLKRCSATLLMGCSSGSLSLKGCYAPQGAPLSFLFAGSPAIIANLWEVTDKDIDRFGKAMLNSWLHKESSCDHCHHCSGLAKEIGRMKIDTESHNKSLKTRSMISRGKKFHETGESDCRNCKLKNRIASHMSEARDSCKLPLLNGASPVCYGVPTLIRKNTEVN